jgi:hypothetical protein
MNPIAEHIAAHWVVYSTAAVALGASTISCMPERFPRTLDEWWSWFRNSLQTSLPARHGQPSPAAPQAPSNPTLPG